MYEIKKDFNYSGLILRVRSVVCFFSFFYLIYIFFTVTLGGL